MVEYMYEKSQAPRCGSAKAGMVVQRYFGQARPVKEHVKPLVARGTVQAERSGHQENPAWASEGRGEQAKAQAPADHFVQDAGTSGDWQSLES